MALTVRYFSTSAAGAGDGTTWADRAALFDGSGNWSTVITGFDFSTNAMEARIGPGTYTCSQQLSTTTITTDTTIANFLLLHGCDSSGNLLDAPDPTWNSCEAQFSDSTFPVIATTTNVGTITDPHTLIRCVKFTASARNGAVLGGPVCLDFVVCTSSTSNTTAMPITGNLTCSNCWFEHTVGTYSNVANLATCFIGNCRFKGPTGSSGNRYVCQANGSLAIHLFDSTFQGGQVAYYSISTSSTQSQILHNCLAIASAGSGFQLSTTGHSSGLIALFRCMATGNGGYGYNPNEASRVTFYDQCRFRDNTSGSVGTSLSQDWGTNYTTDSDDASEYVNSGSGDFTIKNTAAIWGSHYGVAEELLAVTGYTLEVDYIPVTVSGQSASLLAARKLTADHASLTVSPQTASLEHGRLLVADHVSVTVSPQSAALLAARRLSADPVAVAVTPQDAALLAARRLVVDYIPVTISVQDVTSPTITLTAETIIVTLTPQAAGLFAARRLPVDAALLSVAPQSTSLLASRRLVADHVSLAVTPQSAALRRIYALIADHVSITATPQSTGLLATRRMAADYAQLAVSPQDLDLVGPGDRGRLTFSRLQIGRHLAGTILSRDELAIGRIKTGGSDLSARPRTNR